MLSKEVEKYLNIQVDKEVYSSHLYLAMACWAENNGYNGVSEWLYAQADEEKIQWFVTEQIEEEASVKEIIDKLKLVGSNNLYMFDRDILGMRGAGESAGSAE